MKKEKRQRKGKRKEKRKKNRIKTESKPRKILEILPQTEISTLLEKYPGISSFFFSKGHFCFSCPLATSETLEEFCESHGISFEKFKKEIEDFLKKKSK